MSNKHFILSGVGIVATVIMFFVCFGHVMDYAMYLKHKRIVENGDGWTVCIRYKALDGSNAVPILELATRDKLVDDYRELCELANIVDGY